MFLLTLDPIIPLSMATEGFGPRFKALELNSSGIQRTTARWKRNGPPLLHLAVEEHMLEQNSLTTSEHDFAKVLPFKLLSFRAEDFSHLAAESPTTDVRSMTNN